MKNPPSTSNRFVHRPLPLVGRDLLVGDIHFSMSRRRKFSGLSTPLVGSDLLPVVGLEWGGTL